MSTTYSMPFARRSALRLSCLAVASMASVAFLAACDDNQPTAPKPPSAPVTAAPIVIPIKTGSIVMKVFDEKQALITTSSATYQIIRSNGGITSTWTLKDGLVNDSEPAMGVALMKGLVPGTYQVCETEAPVDYALAKPACGVVTVYAGATVGLYLVNPHLPKITFKVVDFIGNLVPNMTFTIKDSANVYSSLVVDNGPLDSDPVGGQLALTLPFESKYTLCETTLPPGYAFPLAQIKFCFDYTVKNGESKQAGPFTLYPIASALWQVTDGTISPTFFYNLIGPSSFKVIAANQTWTDVTDNGVNDIDPKLGAVSVKLPAAGTYQICETVPPVNHRNATPACKTVDVVTAAPKWAEFFINPEKQVINR